MPYDVKRTKKYNKPAAVVYKACTLTIKELGGQIKNQDPDLKLLHGVMDKKLQGKILGDRSQLEMNFTKDPDGNTVVNMLAYPLNAVGQKLMFGARKGVVETVLDVFFTTVEEKLG